jgi:hypothetical protein
MEYFTAFGLTFLSEIISVLFLMYILLVLVVKYLSIYHSTILSGHFDEDRVINGLRITLTGLVLVLDALEFMFVSSIQLSYFYPSQDIPQDQRQMG